MVELFVWLLVFGVLQFAQHEAAHAAVVRWFGGRIVRFVPWPTRVDGAFVFAYVSWKGRLTDAQRALVSVAPVSVSTGVLLSWAVCSASGWAPLWLYAWALTNFVDSAVNLSTFYRGAPVKSDGWDLLARVDVPLGLCRSFALTWKVSFGGLLLRHCPLWDIL